MKAFCLAMLMLISLAVSDADGVSEGRRIDIRHPEPAGGKQILPMLRDQESKELLGVQPGYVLSVTAIAAVLVYIFSLRRKVAGQQTSLNETELHQARQTQQLIAAESILRGHEEERRRAARDLHDGLGGLLSGVKISLSNIRNNIVMTSDSTLVFERSIDMLNNSIQELRRVANNMMPETLIKFGLSTALRDFCALVNSMKSTVINFQTVGEERRPDSSHEIIIYRVVQELVNNALKHSGARHVLVQVSYEGNTLSLTVEDDGVGFDKSILETATGSGWPTIRSRVEYLKGTLDVHTWPGEGTSVYIHLSN